MSFAAALFAALCFGIGTVLEATAARRSTPTTGIDPRLFIGLLRQPAFLGCIAMTALGVGASYVAYRDLPIFVVQAAIASAVGVSTVISSFTHDEPLTTEVKLGIGGIVAGLALLAVASGEEATPDVSLGFRIGLFVVALAFLGLSMAMGRRPTRSSVDVALLGATAGLLFGAGNVGLRVMRGFAPLDLVSDPAAWAALVGGLGGMLVLATTLQRGSVALTAGSVTTSESIGPALVGIILLGERPRAGWEIAALVGFAVALAGAVVLCRDVDHAGTVEPEPAGPDVPQPEPSP